MDLQEQYSEENIRKQLVAKIEKEYGTKHDIKIALFKPVGEYNDETYNYEPILILVDKNYDEIDHNINVWDLVPSDDEQREHWDSGEDDLTVDAITIKF